MRKFAFILPVCAMLTSGCVAKSAFDVVTAPVRATSQVADWATTSQDEADRNRGRELRRREAQFAKLDEDYIKAARKCEDGSDKACREAVKIRAEMDALVPTIPLEPRD